MNNCLKELCQKNVEKNMNIKINNELTLKKYLYTIKSLSFSTFKHINTSNNYKYININ